MKKFLPTSLIVGFCLGSFAQAKLVWDTREISVEAEYGQKVVLVEFPFNVVESDTTVSTVTSSCGCTTAALKKKTYTVGEQDVIKVKFDLGSRVGKQEKVVTLKTDDSAEPEVNLVLKVDIPQLLEIEPRFIYWDRRLTDYNPVSIRVRHHPTLVKDLAEIDYNANNLIVETTRISNQELELSVAPVVDLETKTVTFRKSMLKLVPDVVEGVSQTPFYIYVFMKG